MAFTKYQAYGLLTALAIIVPDQITKLAVLARVSTDPVGDYRAGRFDALAALELHALGLRTER